MKSLTTIQVTFEEDREIDTLKEKLGLPSKKAVVMEGLRALQERIRESQRRKRLHTASHLVYGESKRINQEWASHSSALKVK